MRLENWGILMQNFKGHGGLGKISSGKFDRRLDEAHREEQFVFVTLDDEGEAGTRLRALAEQDLITAGFRLWPKGNVETANFSDSELAKIVALYLDLPAGKKFTGAQLSAARKKTKKWKDAVRACIKAPEYPFHTGAEWGAQLARWALEHRAYSPRREKGQRPIVHNLTEIFHAADMDFPETVKRYKRPASVQAAI